MGNGYVDGAQPGRGAGRPYKQRHGRGRRFRFGALITAAGSSTRIGTSLKKEYYTLKGKSVLNHCIDAFLEAGDFSVFCLTHPLGHREMVEELLGFYSSPDFILVPGGGSRQESVCFGLRAMAGADVDFVLIHDGARPWVTPGLIRAVKGKTRETGSCVPVIDVTDTLIEINHQNIIERSLDRAKIKGVQTPQGFHFPSILRAHERAREEEISATDDSSLFQRYIAPVHTLPGDRNNMKITYKEDLDL